MCDLLCRPDEIDGWGLSPRGAGFLFGADIVKVFNHRNDLSLIARAHQLVMEGFKEMFDASIVHRMVCAQLLLPLWVTSPHCLSCLRTTLVWASLRGATETSDGVTAGWEAVEVEGVGRGAC